MLANDDDFHKQPTQPHLTQGENDQSPHHVPSQIGPYKIEALLDRGGMSYLYLATHPETKEPLTVKVLSRKYISNPEVVQRFLNEAEIISMTNHPNIITMHGHGEWEGGLYIAMEYVEGATLKKLILQQPISIKRALGIILDIAYALCHLHTHGVIHRDLKPENILLTPEGAVKVIDFGIAQLMTEKSAPGAPAVQRLIGTPIYISPEQKENPETVSFPSDIYSLGIIAYELILGKMSLGHIHLALMPRGIQPILVKCLKPDPKDRYQDIVDFITDVSEYLNSPELQSESDPGDQLSRFLEDFNQIQHMLAPDIPPQWPGLEIGIANVKEISSSAIYSDFIPLSADRYAIVMAEPSARGIEGCLCSAQLKGIIRTLYSLVDSPAEMARSLNKILIRDNLGPVFNFNCLIASTEERKIDYISLGYGNLWHFPAGGALAQNLSFNSTSLGLIESISLSDKSLQMNEGDLLLLHSFSSIKQESLESLKSFEEEELLDTTREDIKESPQHIVDHLLRKIKVMRPRNLQGTSICLIGIKARATAPS